jgi:hypothetical protein
MLLKFFGLFFISLAFGQQALADGLPGNPQVVNSNANWISVPSVEVPQFSSLSESYALYMKPTVPSGEIQIGNSFFESNIAQIRAISQVGIAFEERPNIADTYIFYNHLSSNNVFYEIRAYAGYNYQTNFHPAFNNLPISNQSLPLGYGFMGNLGYLIPLNSNVSLLPFIRLSYYNDFGIVYASTAGNSFGSNTYMAQLGARLSLKVNPVFAVYISYTGGYQDIFLNGTGGIYNGVDNPQITGYASTLEFGLPYKLTKNWSLTPSMQFNTNAIAPNPTAAGSPYNARTITFTNNVYAVKLSYDFE